MIKLLWDYIKRFFNNETDFNSNGINDRKELINKLHLYLINQDKIKEEKIQKREDKKIIN